MAEGSRSYRIRQEANPDNRFDSVKVEWEDGVELPQTLRIHKESARSILSENSSPDIPFRYSVNPYRGCAHACAYCYARPTHEYLGLGAGTDFETQIYAKTNAAELLRKKLASKSWRREPITFSGVTDCYQPAESQLRLTRACLEACLEFRNPVSVITKSTLVLRDLDVLTALDREAGAGVVISIPFADEKTARLIEPFAAPPELRFRALEKLSRAGLRTGISLGPVIPGLNDSDIPSLLARAKECGATFAFYVMLRLPGTVREVFLERVKKHLPEKAGKIEHHIRQVRGGDLYNPDFANRMSGTGTMADMVDKLFHIHARKLGLDTGERMGELEARSAGEGTFTGSGAGRGGKEVAPAMPAGNGYAMGAEWVQAKDTAADPVKTPATGIAKSRSKTDPGQLDLFAARP
ncbi:MAG: Radical domain protein [Fibrobacteres bacterium]|nr:Radical domain protein [Fibrobacterota bacterium]